jgi:integrase
MTEPLSQRPTHPRLLERLMQVVRPEFRGEVFHPPRESKVFFLGECVVPACTVMVSHTARGVCEGHYQRWKRHESENPATVFSAWAARESERVQRRVAPPAGCRIDGCNRTRKSHGLCNRHTEAWTRAGRPEVSAWAKRTDYRPPSTSGHGERVCEFEPACPRWTDGPDMALCLSHFERWRTRGRPDLQVWFTDLAHGRDPRVRLTRLERHLRLEVQFGLQCRHDEGTKRTTVRTVVQAVTLIARAADGGLTSLLDWDDEQWNRFIGGGRANRASVASTSLQFIRDTRLRLQILLAGDDPWADLYPRDVWDLRVLGIAHEDVRHFRFDRIPQPWLRALVKRWIRWRLTQDLNPATLAININSLDHVARHLGPGAQLDELDRDRIEAWLATLALDYPDTATRTARITSLGTFLRDVHRHGWEPDLSSTAWCYDDSPPRKTSRPRWIPEPVMRQLESPASLARFPSEDGRLILWILINCGLRLKDARKLPHDCVVRDAAGAPYLAWINHKMRGRIAFFPISEALAAGIGEQQQRATARFEHGTPWLFPRHQANLDGAKSATDGWWRGQLNRWLADIELVDNDKPIRVTAHQFRHTLGTRLINADVPPHVVQQLLDHMSPAMTDIYARLLDKTVREHWERATKVNADGAVIDLPAEHPLADAQWLRLSMVRAKVTLPNGYCGAPIQTDCEYANPCLDCRFFITTPDFLDLHQHQLEETQRLIADAEQAGMRRIVEKNTKTLIKLETLVATLRTVGPRQVVAGGHVEDLDAAL